MGKYYETKHDTYNLKFKEDSGLESKSVIVDSEEVPFLWIDKESGEVSFGGKYFHLYKEQRLIEVLKEFVCSTSDFVHGGESPIDDREIAEGLLEMFDELHEDFKLQEEN